MAIEKHVGESTGIYRTETIGTFRHDSPAEDIEVLHQLIKEGSDLDGKLSAWESDAHEILKGHALTFPAALFANSERNPIVKTAAQLIAEIGNLRTKLANPTPEVRAVALQALRVGRYFERLCVRPFEALVRKDKHVIERNGRSCVVTDDEHLMLCYLRDHPKADISDFVRHVFGKPYNVENRDVHDQRRSRLNKKLSDANIGLSIDISGDALTLSYF